MEIEKPFKCPSCPARFTNEDHLSVHRKRHEMSLNLKPFGASGTSSTPSEPFADETPTPTRFFRNCEEVGLFQDLQNVNPFDDEFAKATPSDFETPTKLRRSSGSEDTLNTPQVFGFLYNSVGLNVSGSGHSHSSTSTVNQATSISVGSCTSTSSSISTSISACQSSLKIPVMGTPPSSSSNSSDILQPILDSRSRMKEAQLPDENIEAKREKCKAASLRARQRRKEWVLSLEERCCKLEEMLARTQSLYEQEKAENSRLRGELERHKDCNVSKEDAGFEIHISQMQVESEHPAGLSAIAATNIGSQEEEHKFEITISLADDQEDEGFSGNLDVPSLPPPPPRVTKRGRPKKGEERRVKEIKIPAVDTQTISYKLPLYPLPKRKGS